VNLPASTMPEEVIFPFGREIEDRLWHDGPA